VALKPYKDYWFDKLKVYRDAGLLIKSGVKCPEDVEELWVLGSPSNSIVKDDNKVVMPINFAICRNGHRHDL